MRFVPIVLFLAFAATLAGAQSFDPEAKQLVLNRSHVVTLKVEKEIAYIRMESISDFSDSSNDYTSMRLDANNNNVIDSRVDLVFGITRTRRYCPQFIYRKMATSLCGQQPSSGSVKLSFERSAYHDTPHPIAVYAIPVAELKAAVDTVGFVFTFYNEGRPTHYPEGDGLEFAKTIAHTF